MTMADNGYYVNFTGTRGEWHSVDPSPCSPGTEAGGGSGGSCSPVYIHPPSTREV